MTHRPRRADRALEAPRLWQPGPWLAGAVILAAGAAAYRTSLHGAMVFDDNHAIVHNETIRSLWPLWGPLVPPGEGAAVQNRPLVNLSLAFNFALGGTDGLQVEGYHLFNLVVHLLAALVLYGLVRRTLQLGQFEHTLRPAADSLAFAVALLWVLHPLNSEAVTYIIQRTESLMGLCYLLTLYAVARAGTDAVRGTSWQVVAVAACLAGMAAKETMATAPLVALAYDRVFIAGSWRKLWERGRWMYAGMAACWGFLAALVLPAGSRGAAAGFGLGVTPWQYAATQFGVVARYLRLCFWPHPLVLDYGITLAREPAEIIPYAVLIAVLAAATLWALWKRPPLGFLGLWFFLILAPSSSIVPLVSQTAAEKRMYLPLAAVVTAVVVGLFGAGCALAGSRPGLTAGRLARAGWCALAAVAAVLAVGTALRNRDYASRESIWADTVRKLPDNPRAHNNLGHALFDAGRYDDAIAHYRQAIAILPRYARAHSNLGNALLAKEQVDEAIDHLRQALEIGADVFEPEPDRAVDLYNLGNAYARNNQVEEAVECFRQALRINPALEPAHNNLGVIAFQQGRPDEALQHFRRVVELHPARATAHSNLGVALMRTRRVHEAVAHYQRALELDPGELTTLNNLAWVLATNPEASLRDGRRAVELAGKAVKQPGGEVADTYRTLAAALAEAGRFDAAARAAQRAADLAAAQGNHVLADQLRAERDHYRTRRPLRDLLAAPIDGGP